MPPIDPVAGLIALQTPGVRPKDDPARIEDAARQFEALLMAQLLKSARAGSEGWLGAGEDPTASSALELAEEQFAGALAAQGGLGLASLIVSGLKPRPLPDGRGSVSDAVTEPRPSEAVKECLHRLKACATWAASR